MPAQHLNVEALTALRVRSGIGPTELSSKAGISASTLYRIEQGETAPRIGTIKALADALGVPVAALLLNRVAA